MINSVSRKCMAIGAAVLMSATVAASANAADFSFVTSGGNDKLVSSKTFTSTTVSGTTIKMQVTAWHWNDPGNDKIVSASLGLWSPGLGVIAPGESASDNEHQIDNIGGVDFLMLQFDHVVSLSGIGRAVFDLGYNPDDSDAAYWADTAGLVGSAATWQSSINLANYTFTPSIWTGIAGNSSSGTTGVTGAPSAAVWLIGAEPKDAAKYRNDGFKLSSINVTAAVPEPATWGMMVIGFGIVGGTIRRRSGLNTLAARA